MSNSLTFAEELVKAAVGGLAPVVALLIGGRFLLDWYDLRKKKSELELDRVAKDRLREAELIQRRREQELDLTKFVRQKQYEAVQELYSIFAAYMALYRLINSGHIDLSDANERLKLLRELAPLEGRVDSAILRIASEFSNKATAAELAKYLPNLRQACQLWRESVRYGKPLPFHSSGQPDYVRFKRAFTQTATYLANRIYERLDPPDLAVDEATFLLTEVFDNKHERRAQGDASQETGSK